MRMMDHPGKFPIDCMLCLQYVLFEKRVRLGKRQCSVSIKFIFNHFYHVSCYASHCRARPTYTTLP